MKSLYDTTSPERGLRALGLTETRFPLQTRTQVPAISNLWKKAKTMNWDPDDIAYATFDRSRYSQEQLDAARLCWSRRAWTEYTGIIESPAMCIRMSLDGKLPIEAKFVLAAKVVEEARHCEASFMLADAMGGYVQEPPPHDHISKLVVAGFRDRMAFNPDVSVEAAMAGWHCISEGVAVDIFLARYRWTDEPVTKEVLRLILLDEVRHVQVGWDFLEYRIPQMTKDEIAVVQHVAVDIMENVEMKGFHSMSLLDDKVESALRDAEEIAGHAKLGFCPAAIEHQAFLKSIADLRRKFAKLGIVIPVFPDVEMAA